jgi:acyl-CoA reductase-like NAD-dependent aldehyde dehydrogenase
VAESITLLNPADETVVRELPLAGRDEVDAAIACARRAAPAWQAVAPADRARLLRRFGDTIAAHADELGRLETANMGMPIGSSTWCASFTTSPAPSTSTPARPSRWPAASMSRSTNRSASSV